jgi:hypothetical protein
MQLHTRNFGLGKCKKNIALSHSYITKEELEQALKEQGLYNAEELKDVISDADSDNVRIEHIPVNLVGIENN